MNRKIVEKKLMKKLMKKEKKKYNTSYYNIILRFSQYSITKRIYQGFGLTFV